MPISQSTKILAERCNDGISVTLFWDSEIDTTWVHVEDSKSGNSFTLDPPKFLALDAFKHPYYYARAELNGICNPRRLNPANVEGSANA